MTLGMASQSEVFEVLSELAPLHLSEAWDNTGWILDLGPGASVSSLLLTIDVTRSVVEEAKGLGVELIIAYHPPIFSGLKKLRQGHPEESLILALIEAQISVYSPHTALDAARGGMTDWLASALGQGEVRPIVSSPLDPALGAGRFIELAHAVSLEEATSRVKKQLGLGSVRVSESPHKAMIRSAAVCPGAGGALFERVADVDLLLTGEMRHHDVLSRSRRGCHVILTEHSNSERGYLPVLAERLRKNLPQLKFHVSVADRDPLEMR